MFVTAYADEAILSRASVPGVLGYLVKPFEDRQLLSTVRIALSCATQVQEGEAYGSRLSAVERGLGDIAEIVRRMDPTSVRASGLQAPPAPPSIEGPAAAFRTAVADAVGARQVVLAGLLDNRRVSTIADALCISQHTVRNHLKAIFKKLDVRSQPKLMKRAARLGLRRTSSRPPGAQPVHA